MPDIQQVWRDTTQVSCGFSYFYETLFAMVRRVNQTSAKKIRVLAGDPPVDWSTNPGEPDRDKHIADVVRNEVLAKHHKALLLFGLRHLVHGDVNNAVQQYERDYPGVTYVVAYHRRFERDNDRLEARMASWPVPSLVPFRGILGEPADSPTRPAAILQRARESSVLLYN